MFTRRKRRARPSMSSGECVMYVRAYVRACVCGQMRVYATNVRDVMRSLRRGYVELAEYTLHIAHR